MCTIETVNDREALLFKRVFEEGEEADEEASNYQFLLGEGMNFAEETETPCSSLGLSFIGRSQDTGDVLRFLFEMTDSDTVAQVERYERILDRIKEYNEPQGDLQGDYQDAEILCTLESSEEEENPAADDPDDIICLLSDDEESEEVPTDVKASTGVCKTSAGPFLVLEKKAFYFLVGTTPVEDVQASGQLYRYESATQSYSKQAKVIFQVVSEDRYRFQVTLSRAEDAGKEKNLFFNHQLASGQHMAFIQEDSSVEWIGKENGQVWGMKLVLSAGQFDNLRKRCTMLDWEMRNRSAFSSLKKDDQAFILGTYAEGRRSSTVAEQDEVEEEGYDFEADSDLEDQGEDGEGSEEEEEEEEEDPDGGKSNPADGDKNTGLAVG